MAFVPFVETDQPTMAAFNEKFQQNYEAAVGSCAKVITGTYVGTGKYPATLTFNEKPQLVVITLKYDSTLSDGKTYRRAYFWILKDGVGIGTQMMTVNSSGSYSDSVAGLDVTVSGNTISFTSNYADNVPNTSGTVYDFMAIVSKEE